MAALLALLLSLTAVTGGSAQGSGELVDPDFTLTLRDVRTATQGLDSELRRGILDEPRAFLGLMSKTLAEPQDLLALVDKSNGLVPDSVPPDLVSLKGLGLTLTKDGLSLRRLQLPDLLAMVSAARAQGVELEISSTYRSYAYQERLYDEARKTQSREQVERELAPPGHSQHQLGTAIDFGSIDLSFAATSAGKWLAANAWRFGYVLSFPKDKERETGYSYEPWHYRYLGKSAAALIQGFFKDRQQAFLVFYARKSEYFRQRLR